MKKKQCMKVLLISIAITLVVGIPLYIELGYKKTPEYVHTHLTPPYEEAGLAFFAENKEKLFQLVELMSAVNGEKYYFYFHQPELNKNKYPAKMLDIFTVMESTTEEPYIVYVSAYEIDVSIGTGTNFDVSLYYGPLVTHSIVPKGEKNINLEDGWQLIAPFTKRS